MRKDVNVAAVQFTNDYLGGKLANETTGILWANGGEFDHHLTDDVAVPPA